MAVRWHRLLLPLLLALSLLLAPMESRAAKKPPGTGGDTGGKATVLTISAPAETYCTQIPVSATLTSRGVPLIGQSISLMVDGQPAGSATTDASGVAIFTAEVGGAGSHQFTVRFAGAKAYAASEAMAATTVAPVYQTFYETRDSHGYYGDPVTLIADGRVSGETITFLVNDVAVGGAVADQNGVAQLTWVATLPAGTHSITTAPPPPVSYGVDPACGVVSTIRYIPGTLYLQPKPATFTYAGDATMTPHTAIVLRAVINPEGGTQGEITRAGPVRFELRTSEYGTPVATYGTVPIDPQGVATRVTDLLPYQTYYVTVLQDGTDNRYYQAPSIRAMITAATLQPTTLTAPNLTAVQGQEIGLRATLKDGQGLLLPDKVVYFQVGATYAGKAITDNTGEAVLPYLVTQGAGSYIVEVWFPGDQAYAESGAAPLLTVTN